MIKKKLFRWFRIFLPSALIIVWFGLAAIGGPYFGKISEQSSTDLTTFLPKNSESLEVSNRLDAFQDENSLPVIIAYEKNGELLSEQDINQLTRVNSELSEIKQVAGDVSPPIRSEDKKAAITTIPLETNSDFEEVFPLIKEALADADLPVSYTLTGPASFAYDLQEAFSGIDSTLIIVALSVVFVILLVVYRSPLLPFIVLLSALSALAVAILAVYYAADADIVQLNGQVQGILFILVIGAATDYSLLYIARYREELLDHARKWDATRAALKASYEPIIAAGATVTAGLLCLLFSDLGSNKALGPVGGIGIALSILVALTLLPSLLYVFGRVAFWPRRPKYKLARAEQDYQGAHPVWAKIGAFVQRHPRRLWVGCTAALLVACVGVFQLRAEGVAQNNLILGESEARDGQEIVNAHFPSGAGSPAYIIADRDHQDPVVQVLDRDDGVDSVSVTAMDVRGANTAPVGQAEDELRQEIRQRVSEQRQQQLNTVRDRIDRQMAGAPQSARDAAYAAATAQIPSIEELTSQVYPYSNATVKVVEGQVLLQATLVDAADSLTARETIERLRDKLEGVDGTAMIGGTTAAQLDTNRSALRDVQVVMPLILVAITIILMLLLRAVVAPLLLLLTTVLSFGATIGIAAVLFNHVWQFPGADPSVIIFGFVFLVALGIDYNIFLMTRVREETIRLGVSKGTIKGLVVTGGVITSAGIVLAATFAALNVIPILFLAQIAFIVAFGVLLDTIVVRSLLVPSLTLEVGRPMWWPSKLWKKRR